MGTTLLSTQFSAQKAISWRIKLFKINSQAQMLDSSFISELAAAFLPHSLRPAERAMLRIDQSFGEEGGIPRRMTRAIAGRSRLLRSAWRGVEAQRTRRPMQHLNNTWRRESKPEVVRRLRKCTPIAAADNGSLARAKGDIVP